MTYYALLTYPIILILISFYGMRIFNNVNNNSNNSNNNALVCWDNTQAKMLRAIACLGVVLHHLTQHITAYGSLNKGPITIVNSLGLLFTSVFFFFSGYGLIYSVQNKPFYLHGFLVKRLVPVLLPFFITNSIYLFVRVFINGTPTTFIDAIGFVLGLTLLNFNSWYIIEIAILYLAFYLIFSLIGNQKIAAIMLCFAAFLLIYICYGNGQDPSPSAKHWFMGEWWFNSTLVFVMGIIFAFYKDKILSFITKHYTLLLIISIMAFIIIFNIEEKVLRTRGYHFASMTIDGINNKLVTFTAQSFLCIITMWTILLINVKITLGNKILAFISKISLELYLIHGIFIDKIDVLKVSDYVKFLVVFTLSIIAAYILNILDSFLIKLIIKANEKPIEDSYTDKKRNNKKPKYYKELTIKERVMITLKKLAIIATALLVISGVYLGITKLIKAPLTARHEIKELSTAQIGDEVKFGQYEISYNTPGYEAITWIVADKKDGVLMLVSKYGIDGSSYHKKHESIKWENSDLCKKLNSEMYDLMFSKYEKNILINNPQTGDKVSLLSIKEAEMIFPEEVDRKLVITNAAEKNGTNINTYVKMAYFDQQSFDSSWWWLRGDNDNITAPIVAEDGIIHDYVKYVNKPKGAIRPVIYVQPY